MKFIAKWSLVICILFCYSLHAMATKDTTDEVVDSLCLVLKQTNEPEKQIETLSSLASISQNTPDEKQYLKELLKIALETDSIDCFYKTATSLGRFYYNNKQIDSLQMSLMLVDSIAKIRNEQPVASLDIRDFICHLNIVSGEYEIAMNEAVSLLRSAENMDYKPGIVASCENMGLIYLLIGRDKDAIPLFERGLDLLKEIGGRLEYEVQIVSYLAISYLHVNDLEKMKAILDHYLLILENKPKNKSQCKRDLREASFCLLYSYYVNYYVANKMPEEANAMTEKAIYYMNETYGTGYTSVFYLAMARYHNLLKDHQTALRYIDKALKVDFSYEPLKEKIHILEEAGKYDEASVCYGETLKFFEKQNVAAYTRQINQLRTFHNIIEKEKEVHLYNTQQIEIRNKNL